MFEKFFGGGGVKTEKQEGGEEVWGKGEDMITASNAVEKGISDTPPSQASEDIGGKFDENGNYRSSVEEHDN